MTAGLNRCCLECGAVIQSASAREFCNPACKQRWMNRRLQRGAELYDLYMAHRFDRAEAQRQRVFQAINRLASEFRQQDVHERGGRRSWRQTRAVLEERPHLRAIITYDGTGRRAAR